MLGFQPQKPVCILLHGLEGKYLLPERLVFLIFGLLLGQERGVFPGELSHLGDGPAQDVKGGLGKFAGVGGPELLSMPGPFVSGINSARRRRALWLYSKTCGGFLTFFIYVLHNYIWCFSLNYNMCANAVPVEVRKVKDILNEITRLRMARKWSEYDLAKHSGVPQSTVSTWYRKKQVPTIKSLEKICKGLGITLSQFFAEGEDAVYLTPTQKEMLDSWSSLTVKQQELFLELFKNIL